MDDGRRAEERGMEPGRDRPVCEICGAEAIGIQSVGCCATTVCHAHAEPGLRDARPGETIVWESGVFVRFENSS